MTTFSPDKKMKTAVYTGTFNPLHIGHLAIMRYLSESQEFDMTYLVVSPQSPFKGYMKADSGKARFLEAQKALARHPGLRVVADDIELHLPAPQYTIRTLDALQEREPGNSFTLVCGADNLKDIDRWKDYRRILTEYGVAVYPRKGYDMEECSKRLLEECREYRIMLMKDAPIVEISSTEIREGIAAGRDMSRFLM